MRDESIHAGMLSPNLKGEMKVFPRGYPHISIDDIVECVLQVQHPTVSQENVSVALLIDRIFSRGPFADF